MKNLEARLTAINAQWEVRIGALNAEYVALEITMKSELKARLADLKAAFLEIGAISAELDNFPADEERVANLITAVDRGNDVKAEWDIRLAAREAELKTLRDAKHDQMEAYEAAINTELEVWYCAWESAYNEELRTTPATGSAVMAEICSICTEDFVHREDTGFQLSCNHQFHQPCLKPWIKDNYTCPLCRRIPSSG